MPRAKNYENWQLFQAVCWRSTIARTD